jgi:hypothetical protein
LSLQVTYREESQARLDHLDDKLCERIEGYAAKFPSADREIVRSYQIECLQRYRQNRQELEEAFAKSEEGFVRIFKKTVAGYWRIVNDNDSR